MKHAADLEKGIASDALAPGKMVVGNYRDAEVLVIRSKAGSITAVSASCSHAGGPLADGLVVNGEIRCPWHHGRFDLATGEALGGAATSAIGCFGVAEKDGIIRVTGKREIAPATSKLTVAKPVVIVGAGGAGYALAHMLARHGCGDDVVLVSEDADAPYDRTLMSKQFLSGEMERDECMMPMPNVGSGSPPKLMTGVAVKSIDVEARAINLNNGKRLEYGTLVLATGSAPGRPDFEGAGHERAFTLRSLADAERLKAAAREATDIVILGGSFIGLEVAAALGAEGRTISVVEQGKTPLAHVLGEEVGRFVQRLHEDKSVIFHTGRQVKRFDGKAVILDNDVSIDAQVLVIGTGVKPRTDLARAAGLALDEHNGGIIVDEMLRTSAVHIHAIGDIASYSDPRAGVRLRIEHWVHSERQGQYLSRLFCGDTKEGFGDTPFFWTTHYETTLNYIGHAKPDHVTIDGDLDAGDFAALISDGPKMRALITCARDRLSLETERDWDKPSHA